MCLRNRRLIFFFYLTGKKVHIDESNYKKLVSGRKFEVIRQGALFDIKMCVDILKFLRDIAIDEIVKIP